MKSVRMFVVATLFVSRAWNPPIAQAADAINLNIVTVHDSPADVASWPATLNISKLTMETPTGLSFTPTPDFPAAWDYHVPGWGANHAAPCPADGCILYTVWPVVQVNGHWHTGGIIQMWRGRASTGAPILSDFHANWAYARDRWGELFDYTPQPGDAIGFFLTAGNARDTTTVTSVRERSNVVLVQLPAGDTGTFDFSVTPAPTPPPVVAPTPAPAPPEQGGIPGPQGPPGPAGPAGPSADLSAILLRLDALEADVTAVKARAVPTTCTASISLGMRIPIACQLR